jgi:hypothetical protein
LTANYPNLQLQKWTLNPNLLLGKKHKGLAPWCLFNISKWEWNNINQWLAVHGYCGQLTALNKKCSHDTLVGEVFGTECVLWIDPIWQAACISHIDSLPKRSHVVSLEFNPTNKQTKEMFIGNYQIFTGYHIVLGSFADDQDAFMATIGWKS